MQYIKRHYDKRLLATLNLLGVISLLGFLTCLVVLLHGAVTFTAIDITLYMVWFATSWLSVLVMKKGDIWGAYVLGIATIAITLFDLVHNRGSLGGAILGTLVMYIVFMYIKTATPIDETLDREYVQQSIP